MEKKDLFDFLLYFTGIHILRLKALKIKNWPLVRFLVFHDVPPRHRIQFENNISLLRKYTKIISINDLVEGKLSVDQLNIVLTFDDGFKNWVDVVLPILQKYNLNATFFISSGLIQDDSRGHNKILRPPYLKSRIIANRSNQLSINDIIEITKGGNIIGSHTVSHVSVKSYFLNLEKEILWDKQNLEEITGSKVKYFAYPFGLVNDHDKKLGEILKGYDFEAAVTLDPGFNTISTNRYFLHRDIVRSNMNSFVFLSRSIGNDDLNIMHFIRKYLGRI